MHSSNLTFKINVPEYSNPRADMARRRMEKKRMEVVTCSLLLVRYFQLVKCFNLVIRRKEEAGE